MTGKAAAIPASPAPGFREATTTPNPPGPITLSEAPMMAPHRDGNRSFRRHPVRAGRGWRARLAAVWLGLLLVLAGGGLAPGGVGAQDDVPAGAVIVVPITGTIDLGLAPFLSRVLDEAAANGAAAVLLEIDTPGGRLDAVLQMRDALLDSPVPTIAYVNRTAFSAGALIAIACEQIYLPPGAAMGAATPVDGGTGETADEKVVSAVRTTFQTTAEARGRDPLVAEAMVDPNVVIPDLVARGELLTLTTVEALRWGYADAPVTSRAEALAAAGLAAAPVVEVEPRLAERAVRLVTDPVVSSLLIILALLLIIGDFFVEGVGLGAAAGIALLGLFFWGHLLAGLAGWEDIALVGLGLGLIALELLVIPGFGVAGVLGLLALGGGLVLALTGRDFQFVAAEEIVRAVLTVAVSLLVVALGLVALLALVPRTKRFHGLTLESAVAAGPTQTIPATWRGLRWFGDATLHPGTANSGPAGLGTAEPSPEPGLPGGAPPKLLPARTPAPDRGARTNLAGATGRTITDLRPSGVAEIEGQRVDVVSAGDYIPAGTAITVVADEQYRRVVRRVAPEAAG